MSRTQKLSGRPREYLEVLEFNDCYAYDEDYRTFWDYIFTSLAEAKPKKLRMLTILPTKLPLNNNDFGEYRNYMKTPDSDEVAEVRRILREDPKRRLFAYGRIDDKYGFTYDDEDDNLNRFQMGDDRRSYDELMLIVEANASIYNERLRVCWRASYCCWRYWAM